MNMYFDEKHRGGRTQATILPSCITLTNKIHNMRCNGLIADCTHKNQTNLISFSINRNHLKNICNDGESFPTYLI